MESMKLPGSMVLEVQDDGTAQRQKSMPLAELLLLLISSLAIVLVPGLAEPTLEGNILWEVNGSMLPGNSVLGIAATRRHHLMEGSNAVAWLEFEHLVANCLDDTGNVIALVSRSIQPFWEFPGTGRSALSC